MSHPYEQAESQAESLPEVVRNDLLLSPEETFLYEPMGIEGKELREDEVVVAPRTLAFIMAMSNTRPMGTIQPKIGKNVENADGYFEWARNVISIGAGRHPERSLLRLALHPERTKPFNTMDVFRLECARSDGIYNRDYLDHLLLTNWIGSADNLREYWQRGCRDAKDVEAMEEKELDELFKLNGIDNWREDQ